MILDGLRFLRERIAMKEPELSRLQTPQQWTSFLSGLVHELRTPLASFRILADLLVESPPGRLGDQERRYVESIREVAQDIQSLLGQVGELTRLLGGRISIRAEETVLEQLIDDVTAEVRPFAWQRGVALTDSWDSSLPVCFRVDAVFLKQALALLLGHLAGIARSETLLRLERHGEDLRCIASSDGPPFSEDMLLSLFTPFQEGSASRSRGGRSLALPLAFELVQALGGELRAENQDGRPAFVLTLAESA